MQVAVLECIKTGTLDLSAQTWRIDLTCDQPGLDCDMILHAAVEDLFDLFENLCVLLGKDFSRPVIECGGQDAELRLDVSATKMWSEIEHEAGVVYARNDYYEDKDNFKLSCAEPIDYDTASIERREQVNGALGFFLEYLFGYTKFRPGQDGIIRKALARKGTLGILPTGSGKSLCYQMASYLQPCVSFVVCPLVSLILDQERNALEMGFCRVGHIAGSMDRDQKNAVMKNFGSLRYQFIWIAPERFQMKDFREQLEEIRNHAHYGYAVIDEAHCISEWGHDFRVSYLRLNDTIESKCGGAVKLALTATASPNVLNDLLAELRLDKEDVQTSPDMDRPELFFHIVRTSESEREKKLGKILDEIDATFQGRDHCSSVFDCAGDDSICGIVFSNTKSGKRKAATCAGVDSLLHSRGIKAGSYHGDVKDRDGAQNAFMNNEFTVMSATKAFGMGVNKKNVRYTVHNGLPQSVEAFYQEAGRAGRDDERCLSECYILYSDEQDQGLVEKVFARDSSVEEIREAAKPLTGDLGTLFYLWGSNCENPEIEREAIVGVFKVLMSRRADWNDEVVIEENLVRDLMADVSKERVKAGEKGDIRVKTEDAVYKLAILGIVEDWTRDWRRHALEVKVAKIDATSEAKVKDSLERYIKRHDRTFSFKSTNPMHRRYIEIYEQAPAGQKLVGLIDLLLAWTHENVLYSRRESMRNILELCRRYGDDKDTTAPDELRRYFNGYFQLNSANSDRMDVILETNDVSTWSKLFWNYSDGGVSEPTDPEIKDASEMGDVSALCDRYRESFRMNAGLEWSTMMSRLLSGKFRSDEIRELFEFLFASPEGQEGIDQESLFAQTVDLMEYAGDDSREAFGEAVVQYAPQFAKRVYEKLGDTATLEYLVVSATGALKGTWGRIGDR